MWCILVPLLTKLSSDNVAWWHNGWHHCLTACSSRVQFLPRALLALRRCSVRVFRLRWAVSLAFLCGVSSCSHRFPPLWTPMQEQIADCPIASKSGRNGWLTTAPGCPWRKVCVCVITHFRCMFTVWPIKAPDCCCILPYLHFAGKNLNQCNAKFCIPTETCISFAPVVPEPRLWIVQRWKIRWTCIIAWWAMS